MQLLPIFASLEMLELVESPMHSFTTPAGHSFVLRQFDDFLYLGVSDSEPQEFVRVVVLSTSFRIFCSAYLIYFLGVSSHPVHFVDIG